VLKNKLFLIVMVLVIGSSLLMAYTSRGNDTSSAAEVVTNVDLPILIPDTNVNRRWSGEVFLSDNDSPDLIQKAAESSKHAAEPACISIDDANSARRYSGCVE
jgi:hypothetical protein